MSKKANKQTIPNTGPPRQEASNYRLQLVFLALETYATTITSNASPSPHPPNILPSKKNNTKIIITYKNISNPNPPLQQRYSPIPLQP